LHRRQLHHRAVPPDASATGPDYGTFRYRETEGTAFKLHRLKVSGRIEADPFLHRPARGKFAVRTRYFKDGTICRGRGSWIAKIR
jgi:hypothetical protein